MRIKKISRDEIMVYLTRQDLEYFDFNPAEKLPQSADLHRFLFEVMELVQIETGFDPYHGGQVVVEATMSASGLNLAISKIGKEKKPMTREEFRNVKKVRVKQNSGLDQLSHKDIMGIIEDLGIEDMIREKIKKKMAKHEVFFFGEFKNLESVLSLIPDNVISDCALYRNKSRYALITKLHKGSRYSNLLSEFADHSSAAEFIEADIREGWKLVAQAETLIGMAGAIRDMQ